jgi:hypothetical protein
MFADFILNLFHCVTNTHILHLSSRSYSEHKALGHFYEGLDALADSLAEAYQGKYGIPTYTAKYDNAIPTGALAYLEGISTYVTEARRQDGFPQDSELQNITDEIQALINSTIYKLRYLK